MYDRIPGEWKTFKRMAGSSHLYNTSITVIYVLFLEGLIIWVLNCSAPASQPYPYEQSQPQKYSSAPGYRW